MIDCRLNQVANFLLVGMVSLTVKILKLILRLLPLLGLGKGCFSTLPNKQAINAI